jgi:ArsR family metal-binding transcriptional regulator
MDLAEFTQKPCRRKLAYEFLPKKKVLINLEKASEELTSTTEIEVKTKVLLITKAENCTISIFPSGKILVRGEKEEEKAKKIAEKLVKTLKESIK